MNKFNVHDTVWVMFSNKPEERIVSSVTMESDCYPDGKVSISYITFDKNGDYIFPSDEKNVFATKEELINSL